MPKNPLLPTGSTGLDISINYDTYFDDILTITDSSGNPVNLTGYQGLEFNILSAVGVLPPLVTFSSTTSTFVFVTPLTNGQVQFQVPVTTINTVSPGNYVYDWFVTDANGHRKKWTAGNLKMVDRGTV